MYTYIYYSITELMLRMSERHLLGGIIPSPVYRLNGGGYCTTCRAVMILGKYLYNTLPTKYIHMIP